MNIKEHPYITFTTIAGIHTVTVDGVPHVFSEARDAIEGKSAFKMAMEYIALMAFIKGIAK